MACGCGRSPDGCRGWHSLSEEEYKIEYDKFLKERKDDLKVIDVQHYTDRLFRFQLERPEGLEFKAGQFTMLNVEGCPKRAYSYTSGPYDKFLEFYSIKVEGGELTSVLKNIEVGDSVNVSRKATGTLITDNLSEGENLHLLATGTGIAPFISILRDPITFEKFKFVQLIWSVREKEELDAFDSYLRRSNISYIPIVTRDESWEGISDRITSLIDQRVILEYNSPDRDRIMVCGNMDFNNDIKQILDRRGYKEGSNRERGTYVLEKAFVG